MSITRRPRNEGQSIRSSRSAGTACFTSGRVGGVGIGAPGVVTCSSVAGLSRSPQRKAQAPRVAVAGPDLPIAMLIQDRPEFRACEPQVVEALVDELAGELAVVFPGEGEAFLAAHVAVLDHT